MKIFFSPARSFGTPGLRRSTGQSCAALRIRTVNGCLQWETKVVHTVYIYINYTSRHSRRGREQGNGMEGTV